MTRSKNKYLVGVGLAAMLAVAVLLGFRAWHSSQRTNLARASAPSLPSLTNANAELRRRLSAANEELRSGPNALETLAELSQLYHANGYLAEAQTCYRCLVQLEPQNPRWPDLLADILAGFGNLEEALPLLQRVNSLAPDHIASRIRLGDALLKLNQAGAARTVFSDALTKQSDNAYALLGLARCEVADERWAAAADELKKCVQLEPSFGAAWALLATVAERVKDTDLSRVALLRSEKNARFHEVPDPWIDELLEACYDPYKLRVAASVARSSGKSDVASKWLQRALKLSPDDPAVLRDLGKLEASQKDFSAAKSHLSRATELAPEESENWIAYVTTAQAAGEISDATRALLAGISRNPSSPGLHLLNGRRLAALRDYDSAISEFETAQKLRPNEADPLVELALVALRRGQPEAAVEQLNAALRIETDHPMALMALIRISIDQGDRKTSDELLRRAALQSRVSANDMSEMQSAYRAKFGAMP